MDLRWKRNSFQYSGLILNMATFIPKSLFLIGATVSGSAGQRPSLPWMELCELPFVL